MYIYVYISYVWCVCVCTYTCMHAFIHTRTHTHARTHTRICKHTHGARSAPQKTPASLRLSWLSLRSARARAASMPIAAGWSLWAVRPTLAFLVESRALRAECGYPHIVRMHVHVCMYTVCVCVCVCKQIHKHARAHTHTNTFLGQYRALRALSARLTPTAPPASRLRTAPPASGTKAWWPCHTSCSDIPWDIITPSGALSRPHAPGMVSFALPAWSSPPSSPAPRAAPRHACCLAPTFVSVPYVCVCVCARARAYRYR